MIGTRLDTPTFAIRDYTGTTTSDAFEIQTNAGTVYFKVIGGTDAGAPGTVVTKDIVPFLNATYKLGNTTHSYDAHLNNTVVYGSYIRPSTTGGANLGSTALHFATGWIDNLVTTGTVDVSGAMTLYSGSSLTINSGSSIVMGGSVTGNWNPTSTLTYTLGDGSHQWNALRVNNIFTTGSQIITSGAKDNITSGGQLLVDSGGDATFSSGSTFTMNTFVTGAISPSVTATYSLGDVSHKWISLFVSSASMYGTSYVLSGGTLNIQSGGTLSINPGSTYSVGSDYIPQANNTYDIATSGARIKKIYTTDIDISGTCTGCSGVGSSLTILTDGSTPAGGAVKVYGEQGLENYHADTYGTAGGYPGFYASRTRGTIASPTAIQASDKLGVVAFGGYDGSTLASAAAQILTEAEGNWTGSSHPIRFQFLTTAVSSTTPTCRWLIENDGPLLPCANNTYPIGSTGNRLSNLYSVLGDFSSNVTVGGTLGVTGTSTLGVLTDNGAATFNSTVTFASTSTISGNMTITAGIRANSDSCCTIGANGTRFATVYTAALSGVDTLALTAIGAIFAPNGNSGLSVTKTVRDSAGTGTCTLIFSAGILTGGTC